MESDEEQTVFRLVYRSRLRVPPRSSRAELGAIHATARTNNTRLGVSGALLVWNESIVQVLEGEEATVRDLYATIHDDPRHDDVRVISEKHVAGRVFGRWAMAAVADEGTPDLALLLTTGGIDEALQHPTPEEEALLSELRGVLRGL